MWAPSFRLLSLSDPSGLNSSCQAVKQLAAIRRIRIHADSAAALTSITGLYLSQTQPSNAQSPISPNSAAGAVKTQTITAFVGQYT